MRRLAISRAALATALAPAVQAQIYRSDDRVTADDPHYTAPDPRRESDSAYNREYDRSDSERDGRRRGDPARVLESRPVCAQGGGTHEECWNDDTRRYEGRHIGAGTVIGAIAGGVLGHQVGSGRGNDVATAAGAIGGGVIGNRIENRDEAPSGDTRCRTVSDSGSGIVAYDSGPRRLALTTAPPLRSPGPTGAFFFISDANHGNRNNQLDSCRG